MREIVSSVATVYYTIVYIAVCCDKQCRRGFGLGSYARLRTQILLVVKVIRLEGGGAIRPVT